MVSARRGTFPHSGAGESDAPGAVGAERRLDRVSLAEGIGLIWIAVVGLFKLAPMWRSRTAVPPEPAWYPWARSVYLFVFKVTVPVMVLLIAGGIIFIGVYVDHKDSAAGRIVKLFGGGIAAIAGVVLFTVIAWERPRSIIPRGLLRSTSAESQSN